MCLRLWSNMILKRTKILNSLVGDSDSSLFWHESDGWLGVLMHPPFHLTVYHHLVLTTSHIRHEPLYFRKFFFSIKHDQTIPSLCSITVQHCYDDLLSGCCIKKHHYWDLLMSESRTVWNSVLLLTTMKPKEGTHGISTDLSTDIWKP